MERLRAKKIKERAKTGVKVFKREFKKQMSTAILAAFGFLIALVWKDVVTETVTKLSGNATLGGTVIGAIIVTIICVLGIMIVSRMLKEKEVVKDEQTNK